MLTNRYNTVLYIGVTNNLKRRVCEHKTRFSKGFTWRYNVDKLVYYENFKSISKAILREKRLKKWKRAWKEELINNFNPGWRDLYEEVLSW